MLFNKEINELKNGSQELKQYANWTTFHEYNSLEAAFILAKKQLFSFIDKETYQFAVDAYLLDTFDIEADTFESKLVHILRHILVNFAYYFSIEKQAVLWDNSGIKVAWNDDFRPAQKDTLAALKESLLNDAYEFTDSVIDFLNENNHDCFVNSLQAKNINDLIVNSAEEFSLHYNIKNSFSRFLEFLPHIRNAENLLKSKLGNRFVEIKSFIKAPPVALIFASTREELTLIASVEPDSIANDGYWFYIYAKDKWCELIPDFSNILSNVIQYIIATSIANKAQSDLFVNKLETLSVDAHRSKIKMYEDVASNHLTLINNFINKLTKIVVVATPTAQKISATKTSLMI